MGASMFFLRDLSFGFGPKLPLVLQTEATECGLACLAMVAGFHRHHTDLGALRRTFQISLKGATLAILMQIAGRLNMGSRPLKLELEHLDQLKLPCILHWEFNHFVVLKAVGAKTVTIYDPALGRRHLSWAEVSSSFTGVALELWPNDAFKLAAPAPAIKLCSLMGRVSGLYRSFGQILLLALALEVFALISPFYLMCLAEKLRHGFLSLTLAPTS